MSRGALIDWFTGGPSHSYMKLVHCLDHDWTWIAATVALDLLITAGYLVIARHWWKNERRLPDGPARRALGDMRAIFLLCGVCGYLFIPIKMFWPAWRLYDAILVILAAVTWRYALSAQQLRVIYGSIGDTARLTLELRRSRKESRAKSGFIGALAHDLRTPLAGLVLNLDEARQRLDDGDRASLGRSLDELRSCVARLTRMVNDAVEMGRLELDDADVRLDRCELRPILDEVADDVRPDATSKGVRVHVNCPPGLLADTNQFALRRIVLNLAENAVKFSSSGEVCLLARADGHNVSVAVTDQGIGINHVDLLHVFDPLYQVDNPARDPTRGYGMGLAIAQRLAERLDAKIDVESEIDRGSRFTIRLPTSDATRA